MRRVLPLLVAELWVAVAICAVSALQASAIAALVSRALGPASSPPPERVLHESAPPARQLPPLACVARALEGGVEPARRADPPPTPRSWLGGVRLVPSPLGLRVQGAGPGSLLGALGLADGDVITRVGALDARRPDAALFALSRLRAGGDVELGVWRNGNPVTLTYHVR